jgi:hypothetical protein
MTTTDEPIATYTERLLEVRRDFTLYQDRVVVRARWLLKGRFESTVPLDTLSGETREVLVRYRMFRYAGWVMALGAIFFAMAYYSAEGGPIGILGYIALGLAVLGAAFTAATYPNRRIRFTRFDARSGRGGLDVGLAGNSAEAFHDFVEHVARQIARSR